jgi:Methyltransferase domain
MGSIFNWILDVMRRRGLRMPACGSMRVDDIELRIFTGTQLPESTDHLIHIHKPLDFLLRLDDMAVRLAPQRMVEIGIFHGGSAIYWHQRLKPKCLSVLDITPGVPSFEAYVRRNRLQTMRAHFGVSQDDTTAVRRFVTEDMGGAPIDLVIDDASHMYAPTLAAFECLFPMLRPRGAYVIEDWAWGHAMGWPPTHWSEHPLMSPLIAEAMLACGHMTNVINRVEIDKNYAVLWRGDAPLPQDGSFRLKDHYCARGFALP